MQRKASIEKARGNVVYNRALKEYALTDIEQALGKSTIYLLNDRVIVIERDLTTFGVVSLISSSVSLRIFLTKDE